RAARARPRPITAVLVTVPLPATYASATDPSRLIMTVSFAATVEHPRPPGRPAVRGRVSPTRLTLALLAHDADQGAGRPEQSPQQADSADPLGGAGASIGILRTRRHPLRWRRRLPP